MRLNFPSEWFIKTVNGDPSNHSSDQEVINTHVGTHTKIAIISLLKPLYHCIHVAKLANTVSKNYNIDSMSHLGSYFMQSSVIPITIMQSNQQRSEMFTDNQR